MHANRLTSSAGFTLIAAIVAVVIIGIMSSVSVQSWHMFMKREREEELMFRGIQYRNAITSWYNYDPNRKAAIVPPGGKPVLQPTIKRPLKDLKYLLQDPNSANTVKYLRRLYTDPITNKDFEPVLDGSQNIIGVRSTSEDEPLKTGNFPEDLKVFLTDKKKYSDWQFVYGTQPAATSGGVTLPGTFGGGTGTSGGGTGTPGGGTGSSGGGTGSSGGITGTPGAPRYTGPLGTN